MADNTTLPAGAGGDTISTDDIGGGVKVQNMKVQFGGDGVATAVELGVGLPVSIVGTVTVSGTVTASGPLTDAQLRATPVPVSGTVTANAGSGTFTVAGTVTANAGSGTFVVSGPLTDAQLRASAVPVSLASVPSHAVTVTSGNITADTELTTADLDTGAGTDTRAVVGLVGTASGGGQLIPGTAADGLLVNLGANNDVTVTSGNITVSGTVAATQSGTWNITNISGTVSLPTGAATAANQATANASLATIAGTVYAVGVTPLANGVLVMGKNASTSDSQYLEFDASNNVKVAVQGTVSVNTELNTAAALADGASASVSTATVGAVPLLMNGAGTVDRARAIVNAMDSTGTGVAAVGIVAQVDDTTPTAVTENQFGPVRMSTRRALLVEGVAGGTAVPISGTVTVTGVATETTLAAMSAKLPAALVSGRLDVTIGAAPATLTVNAHAVTNAGTFAVQDSEKIADNAGFTDGTTKVLPVGFVFDETAGTALTENDAAAARVDSKRAQVLVIEDETTRGRRATVTAANAVKVDGSAVTQPVNNTATATGGATYYHLVSAATTNATNVKSSAGKLMGWYIYNSNASARKVAFHNTSGTPTAGASVVFSIMVPGGAAANLASETGIAFSTGIGITTVTGIADSDSAAVAANDLIINLWYA